MSRSKIRYPEQIQNGPAFVSVATKSTGDEALTGVGQSINGHTVAAGDRILVTEQTTTTEDGIYIAAAGAWSRSRDAFAGEDAAGMLVAVQQGTDANSLWMFTNNTGSGVIGTDDLTIEKKSGLANTEVYGEAPTVTDASADVTLANAPVASTVRVYLNGQRQNVGGGNDYTLAGSTITFADPLSTGECPDIVVVDYQY